MNDTAIERFDQVPRPVPRTLLAGLYFGGFEGQFGWLFVGFGMVFVWLVVMHIDLPAIWQFTGPLTQVQAHVVSTQKTSYSEGGSKHHKGTPVYRIDYRFDDAQHQHHTGISYARGYHPRAGVVVHVEFPQGHPEINRIHGMRRAPVRLIALLVLIFPLVGGAAVVFRWVRGRRAHRLLKTGRLAVGKLKDKTATSTRINKRVVYKMTFAFTDDQGVEQTAVTRTSTPEKLENSDGELMLYDPLRPKRTVMLDTLPSAAEIDDEGLLKNPGGLRTLKYACVPLLAIVVNLAVAKLNGVW